MRAPATIKDAFAVFWQVVAPGGAPPDQYREMRRAFYAGFHQALCSLDAIVGPDECSEDDGVAVLERLHEEAKQFAKDIADGRA